MLKLRVRDEQEVVIDAVYFGNLETFSETLCGKYGAYAMDALLRGEGKGMKLSLTYYPDINEYRGKKRSANCDYALSVVVKCVELFENKATNAILITCF